MEQFADILKELKDEKGLSLRMLAVDSGISATQYSKYLKGAYPTIFVAEKMAKYFNCSFDYLFGISEIKSTRIYKDIDMSKFVSRYKKLLSTNKTTNWQFSKKYNLSESNLRHWKYGDIPKIETLIVIADNLSSSIDYLIGRTDN